MAGMNLTKSEISAAFDGEAMRQEFGPILSPDQVGQMLGVSRSTIYFWIQTERFNGAFRKRGKHNFFWRDRVIDIFFNGPKWQEKE